MRYDDDLYAAKAHMTRVIAANASDKRPVDIMEVANAVDGLNRAWDELTNCLVRQRSQRDATIVDLLNQLAEAKK